MIGSPLHTKLENGTWHVQTVPFTAGPDRRAVRHHWAEIIERVHHDWDHTPMPYGNWGYDNKLDHTLSRLQEETAR